MNVDALKSVKVVQTSHLSLRLFQRDALTLQYLKSKNDE